MEQLDHLTREEYEEKLRRSKESVARVRRHKKAVKDDKAEILAKIALHREKQAFHQEEMEALYAQLYEDKADLRHEQSRGLANPVEHRPFDTVPDEDSIPDIAQWSRDFRRRCWGTAFSGGFSGKKGTTMLFVALALAHLMETQGTRVVEADIPEIVRVVAMDYKTVRPAMEALWEAGLLLRTAKSSYILVADPLVPLSESPEFPEGPLAQRLLMGNRGHDAFGGRHGIGTTEIRIWAYMLLHPGLNRNQIAKGVGSDAKHTNRLVETLVSMGLARICDDGTCFALSADKSDRRWLENYSDSRALFGATEERVERAKSPDYYQRKKGGPKTPKSELDFGDAPFPAE